MNGVFKIIKWLSDFNMVIITRWLYKQGGHKVGIHIWPEPHHCNCRPHSSLFSAELINCCQLNGSMADFNLARVHLAVLGKIISYYFYNTVVSPAGIVSFVAFDWLALSPSFLSTPICLRSSRLSSTRNTRCHTLHLTLLNAHMSQNSFHCVKL